MSTSLRLRLSDLAASFASEVLSAIRGASLEELVGEHTSGGWGGGRPSPARTGVDRSAAAGGARKRPGRLPRRSADDIAGMVERIVGLLRQSPDGLRAEQIREKLDLEAKELPRPLKEALDAGRLSKSGQKRATTYFAKGAGGGRSGKSSGRGSGSTGKRGRRAGGSRHASATRGGSAGRSASGGRKGRVKASKRSKTAPEKKAAEASAPAPTAES